MKTKLLLFFSIFIFSIKSFAQQWHQELAMSTSYGPSYSAYVFDIGKDSGVVFGHTYSNNSSNPALLFKVYSTKNDFISSNLVASTGMSASFILDVNYISDTVANFVYSFGGKFYMDYSSSFYSFPPIVVPVTSTWLNPFTLKSTSWKNKNAYFLISVNDSAFIVSYNKITHIAQTKAVFPKTGNSSFSMDFMNDSTGCISLWDSLSTKTIIYKTTNYGTTWTNVYTNADTLNAIHFPSENTGYAVGLNGTVLKTTTAGSSWSSLAFPVSDSLSCVHFLNNDTGYIGANKGNLYKTFDGGATWTYENSGVSFPITKIKMVNNHAAYFVSSNQNYTLLYKNNDVYTTGIKEFAQENNTLTIFPNPGDNVITLKSNKEFGIINIYNNLGTSVLQTQSKQNSIQLDISQLPAGIYIINSSGKNSKLIKQ